MSTLTVTVPKDNFEIDRMVYYQPPKGILDNNKRPNPNIFGSPKPYVYDRAIDLRNTKLSRNKYHGIGNN